VLGFQGAYHTVLEEVVLRQIHGHPELHLPQAVGVEPTYGHAYKCDVECIEYAEALVEFKALIVDLENLINKVPTPRGTLVVLSGPRQLRISPSIPLASVTKH
jgi:hypothetical protein